MINKGKTIYVDVDGTLYINGELNKGLISWCKERKADGHKLILWSARGDIHARMVSDGCGITDLFDYILSKPMCIVDDKGWSWTKYVKNVGIVFKKGTPEL